MGNICGELDGVVGSVTVVLTASLFHDGCGFIFSCRVLGNS